MKLRPAVLCIWYTDSFGNKRREPQGKFFYLDGKPVFLADMNPNKLWRKFNGYSIAKQILEVFSELKLRPQIIYRLKSSGLLYYAKPTSFTTKGIMVSYGNHQQYILPIKNFEAKQKALINEPKNLPLLDLDRWKKLEEINFPEPEPRPSAPLEKAPFSLSERFKQVCSNKTQSQGALN
ncbi:MAG TPA: hypothetical protein VD999_05635 [Vitreimonas sp.]|nr:hypothetical protein [Vitreimonas sp.]